MAPAAGTVDAAMEPLPRRRTGFDYPADLSGPWSPRQPEFSAVADGLSLLMPHLEPLVVRTVVEAVNGGDVGDAALAERARGWARQETTHQLEHRRFNDLLVAAVPGLGRVDRAAARVTRWLSRRNLRFRLAFTTGFEAVAYAVARWVEPRIQELLTGAQPAVATMFLWHLAEEVEHKDLAHEVHEDVVGGPAGHGPMRRCGGGFLALGVIGPLTLAGALVVLAAGRRLRHPSTWWALTRWSVSFAFEALAGVGVLASRSHHPRQMADPLWYRQFLRGTDPATGEVTLWQPPAATDRDQPGQGRPRRASKGPVTS